jgi:hypothetical protein
MFLQRLFNKIIGVSRTPDVLDEQQLAENEMSPEEEPAAEGSEALDEGPSTSQQLSHVPRTKTVKRAHDNAIATEALDEGTSTSQQFTYTRTKTVKRAHDNAIVT